MSANSSAQYLDVMGRPGFVATFGAGVPVVCLHTAGQSGLQWRDAIPGLVAAGYQVVVPDLPGHGHSEQLPGGPVVDLGVYADWTVEVIDALGLDRPFVVGCSIGGKVVLDIGTKIPERLSGIIAMAADAVNDGQNERSLRRNLQDSVSPSRTDRTYFGTLAAVGRSVDDERRVRIAERHRREDPQVALSDLIAWARHDLLDTIGKITCPAHLVVGDDDFWLDPRSVERTAAAIPGAQHTVLDGIGHYPMEEMADAGQRIVAWLAGLTSDIPRLENDT